MIELEDEGETGEEQRTIAERGAKNGGGAAEDYFDRGMMLRFEQRKELEVGDATDLKGGIGKIPTRKFLDNLNHTRTGCDGATGEMRPIDGTVGMERDAIDCSPTLALGQGGLRCDVIEIILECHKSGDWSTCDKITACHYEQHAYPRAGRNAFAKDP